MKIKKCKNKDLPRIREILLANQLPVDDLPDDTDVSFWAVFQGEDMIGVGGMEIHEQLGLVRSVAVLEEYQTMGLGNKIIGILEHQAAKMGVSALYLLTNTAELFFTRLGYEVLPRNEAPASIKQNDQFSLLCCQSAVVMKKNIRI